MATYTYTVIAYNLSNNLTDDVVEAIKQANSTNNDTLINMTYSQIEEEYGEETALANEDCVKLSKRVDDSHIRDVKDLLNAMDDAENIAQNTTYGDDILIIAIPEDGGEVQSWSIVSQGVCQITTFDFTGTEDTENQYRIEIAED